MGYRQKGTGGFKMKYKILTPQEQETYKIGYQVGNRQIVITEIEWENEEENKIYRKGYMAGLMDYKRNNKVSNVSFVNNVDSITPTTPKTPICISNSISISKDKGGMGGKENPNKVSNVNILHLGEMNLVKLTEDENKKIMIKCHGTGRPEPSARYVLAIRKINAWMATGTKATERYKPANKTHYGLFADGNWVWDDIPYDIEKQKKFSETREDWLASINFIKGEQNDNK